jgi:hypothetical protein
MSTHCRQLEERVSAVGATNGIADWRKSLDMMIIILMVWDYVSELQPLSLSFITRWYMSLENHGVMILAGENT